MCSSLIQSAKMTEVRLDSFQQDSSAFVSETAVQPRFGKRSAFAIVARSIRASCDAVAKWNNVKSSGARTLVRSQRNPMIGGNVVSIPFRTTTDRATISEVIESILPLLKSEIGSEIFSPCHTFSSVHSTWFWVVSALNPRTLKNCFSMLFFVFCSALALFFLMPMIPVARVFVGLTGMALFKTVLPGTITFRVLCSVFPVTFENFRRITGLYTAATVALLALVFKAVFFARVSVEIFGSCRKPSVVGLRVNTKFALRALFQLHEGFSVIIRKMGCGKPTDSGVRAVHEAALSHYYSIPQALF